jgi:hypothetical protein
MHFDIHLGLAGIGGTSSDVSFKAEANFNLKKSKRNICADALLCY